MTEQKLREKMAWFLLGKGYNLYSPDDCVKLAEALIPFIEKANYVRLADVLEAIKNEPEFPGDMPDELWDEMNGNREICTRVMQNSVRLTKQGITKRLAKG